MPGYGDSDPPPEPWTPESLARILAAGLVEIVPPPQRFDLAAFSFGGIIAGHLAAPAGERVGRLVLPGPGGFALPSGEAARQRRPEAGLGQAGRHARTDAGRVGIDGASHGII